MKDDRYTIRDLAQDAAGFLAISAFIVASALLCIAMKPLPMPV